MNYKSLNSAILSVTNPQPELVKEDYQTRERDRQIANLGKPVPAIDSKEKASKKVYGKDGRVEHKSLADMLKKANKKSTVKEEQEYIERLEFALESIAEELECSVEDLLEDLQTRGRYLQVDPKATHSERLADIKGRKERKSKKVYGMHGKELAPSAAAYFKKHPTASRLLHNPSTAGD